MPKVLRYGLIIVVIVMILYLAARNFDDVIYSVSHALFDAKEQEEMSEDVFGFPAGQGEPEDGAVK